MKSSKQACDNHANQLNPQHPTFYRGRGVSLQQAVKAAKIARGSAKPPQPPKKPG